MSPDLDVKVAYLEGAMKSLDGVASEGRTNSNDIISLKAADVAVGQQIAWLTEKMDAFIIRVEEAQKEMGKKLEKTQRVTQFLLLLGGIVAIVWQAIGQRLIDIIWP